MVSHPRAEVLYIYSGDKTPLLSTDSTGSTDPDLVLPFDGPWTTALDLFASRQIRWVDRSAGLPAKKNPAKRRPGGDKLNSGESKD
jgi:hypothetical protein